MPPNLWIKDLWTATNLQIHGSFLPRKFPTVWHVSVSEVSHKPCFLAANSSLPVLPSPVCGSLVPRPHLREGVWWHPADSSGFINFDYFLERDFSLPITLQKTQSAVQHRKSLAASARWHSTFLACKLVISFQLCIQQAYEFLIKPEESAGCHQILSAWVGSGDETSMWLPVHTPCGNHMTSPDFTRHHMTSPDLTRHHMTSQDITWHHKTSHNITSQAECLFYTL